MDYGANAGVDAIAHGLAHRLAQDQIETRVIYADFRQPDWQAGQADAVRAGVAAGVDAIVVYVLDADNPADAVAEARAAGVPVFTLERPHFAVDGCVVYPNFNHGTYMAEHLATLLPAGAEVGVIGGPDVVDDIELLLGIQHGLRAQGLTAVNDPFDPRYKNDSDVAEGGHEKTLNLLADFAHLDGLVPYNDETLHGTLDALRETGRLGEMKMVSTERHAEGRRGDPSGPAPRHVGSRLPGHRRHGRRAGRAPARRQRGARRLLRGQPDRADDHSRERRPLGPVVGANSLRSTARRRLTRSIVLDEMDKRIVRVLQKNARTPNTEIARALGVTETTIRNRVARLLDEKQIGVVAVVNPEATEATISAFLEISLHPKNLDAVVEKLRGAARCATSA